MRLSKERKLAKIFRFIDNFTALSDVGEFDLSFQEIYPSELVLKKQICNNNKGCFLELHIKS